MLHDIHIRNLGVIEETAVEFADGLTVVTGETGAGKTMVVSSLRLLSGHRADASKIRVGADKATIEGIFSANEPASRQAIEAIVDDIGGFADDNEYIASRTLSASGRSRAHFAGKTVAAGVLAKFADQALTIHGQNDQLRLKDSSHQLDALDEFANLHKQVGKFQQLRKAWLASKKDLEKRTADRRELALEAETLERALETIDEIDPQPGEDEELKSQITRLQDADELRSAMRKAMAAIDGSEDAFEGDGGEALPSATDLLGQAQSALAVDDEELEALSNRLNEVNALLADIVLDIGTTLANVPDPEELENMLHRQQELRELRRFAVDVNGALKWRDEAQQRLASIDVSGEAIAELTKKVEDNHQAMMAAGERLSAARHKAAKKFGSAVSQEIKGLQMSAAVEVKLTTVEPHGQGLDHCEFQLVQGGHRTALASSASGGELSRVMLALELILAGSGRTMVFDEVDAGVGGKAAVEIGRRLAMLARDNQVIVVTHLPQVAAFADAHLYVAKSATDSTVSSSVKTLATDERIDELSRMLAGLESDTGRAHAEELYNMAAAEKKTAEIH